MPVYNTLLLVLQLVAVQDLAASILRYSSGIMTSNAANTVFNIPELTEMVLGYLDTKDLVRCQRVSRSFRSIILDSPTLKKTLFLEALPVLGRVASRISESELDETACIELPAPWLNPLFDTVHWDIFDPNLEIRFSERHLSGILKQGLRWGDTFITQPPVSNISLSYFVGYDSRLWSAMGSAPYENLTGYARLQLSREDGVRVRDVAQKLRDVLERCDAQMSYLGRHLFGKPYFAAVLMKLAPVGPGDLYPVLQV